MIDRAIELYRTQGGIYGKLEQQVMYEAAKRIGNPETYELRRVQDIGYRYGIPSRPEPEQEPTPLDAERSKADADLEPAIRKREAAQEEWFLSRDAHRAAERERKPDAAKVARLAAEMRDAEELWKIACAEEGRARVRANALAAACTRWRTTEAYVRNMKEAERNRRK